MHFKIVDTLVKFLFDYLFGAVIYFWEKADFAFLFSFSLCWPHIGCSPFMKNFQSHQWDTKWKTSFEFQRPDRTHRFYQQNKGPSK